MALCNSHVLYSVETGDTVSFLVTQFRNDGCVRNKLRSNITIQRSISNVEHGAHNMVSFATSMLDEPDVIKFMQRANKARLNL